MRFLFSLALLAIASPLFACTGGVSAYAAPVGYSVPQRVFRLAAPSYGCPSSTVQALADPNPLPQPVPSVDPAPAPACPSAGYGAQAVFAAPSYGYGVGFRRFGFGLNYGYGSAFHAAFVPVRQTVFVRQAVFVPAVSVRVNRVGVFGRRSVQVRVH